MTTPRTAAGRALLDDLFTDTRIFNGESITEYIIAIEAEARAAALDVETLARAMHSPCAQRTSDAHWNAHWDAATELVAEYKRLSEIVFRASFDDALRERS